MGCRFPSTPVQTGARPRGCLQSARSAPDSCSTVLVRKGEVKHRSLRGGLGPDAASGALHDFFANGQTQAAAGIRVRSMEALERDKDCIEVVWFNADAIVRYGKMPHTVMFVRADIDTWRLFR